MMQYGDKRANYILMKEFDRKLGMIEIKIEDIEESVVDLVVRVEKLEGHAEVTGFEGVS